MRSLSPVRLVSLGVAGLVAVALAVTLARDAAGNAFQTGRTELALRADPYQANALARMLDAKLTTKKKLAPADARAIERTLEREPLSPALLRLLGFALGQSSDTARSRTLLALAERVSRRDYPTQIWMIEDAVQRGNVAQALAHYDIALTTSRAAAPLLLPVLTQALSEPDIRSALANYLRRDRPWTAAFLAEAIATGEPRSVASLFAEVGRTRHDEAFHDAQAGLIGLFVGRKDYAGLARYVGALPERDIAAIRTIGFERRTTDRTLQPLTWELTDTVNLTASFDDAEGLRISAREEMRGTAVRRIVFVPRGRWQWRYAVAIPEGAMATDAQWIFTCLNAAGGRPFWAQSMPMKTGVVRTTVDVPDCQAIEIRVDAGGGIDSAAGTERVIADVALVSVR